jgi:NADH:ubiquinone oxidoreductase subunit 6 (subunit J)
MDFTALLFWVLAVATGACAVAVVVSQNIVRAATWLLFTLCGTAGIYFLLGAAFVGATQLLVYVGGTLVLVVFGVMLTAQGPFIQMRIGVAEWAIATLVGFGLFSVLAISLMTMQAPRPVHPSTEGGKGAQLIGSVALGQALLGVTEATPRANLTGLPDGTTIPRKRVAYLLPFEIVSIHLLVVLIAAAYLARAKRRKGAVS